MRLNGVKGRLCDALGVREKHDVTSVASQECLERTGLLEAPVGVFCA